ncbi:MAG TPA: hypothetical protein VLI89_13705 [Burkholderiales bacterium]|nr:hypothetical protein [Burkholderiales bacterium]
MKFGVRAAIFSALLAGCAVEPPRELPAYREVVDAADSARPTAERLLQHLAAGEIDDAAALSNAPGERAELLRAYRDRVGESEFRRVFAEYAAKPAVREFAIGERRLLLWDLAGPLGAQYFVRSGERFVLDDVPSAERSELRRVLAAYRAGRLKPLAGTE